MKKKLLSVLLCATMAVSMFAGCGSDATVEPTTAPTATTAPTEAADPTAAPTAAPTEAPVVTAEELPEPVYYFGMEDATGLSARKNTSGTTMDERVYLVEDELQFTNGVKGNALWLDGNYGAQIDAMEPINTDTYTLSFWVWCARFSTYGTTVQFGNGMAVGTTEHWLSFTTPDAGVTYPYLWNRNAALSIWPNPSYETETCYGRKSWAHIVLVCDENDLIDLGGTMVLNAKCYVNGVPSENEIQIVPGLFTGDKVETDWRFLLGVNPWDTIMKGAIDELYVFDEALTAGQVATLYADGDKDSVPAKSTEPEPEVIRDYSATAASGTILGNTDGSSVYGETYSDIIEVPVGQTVAVKFKNYVPSKLNDAGKNVYDFANTFSLILQNVAEGHSTADNADYKEYAVISGSEGYEASAKISDLNVTRNTFNQFNPEKFTTDSDLATYTVAITNYGTTAKVTMKASCADAIIRYVDVEEIAVDGSLYYCLTTNGSFIDIAAEDAAYGQIVGNTDCSTPWWTAFSDTVKVEEGTTAKVHFKNYTNGNANWNNFLVVLQNIADAHAATDTNGYKEYAVLRADAFGWGSGYDGIVTPESNFNWDTYTSDMNGADVILEITNNGTTADVVATIYTKSGTVYTEKYLGVAVDGDLYYCLTAEGAYVEIKGTPVGLFDNSTPWWTNHSDTVKVEAGTTERVYFKNYTSGANNWNNFLVVLQNVPDVHSAEVVTEYKEYAVLRADNFGWGSGYDGIATAECNYVWETFTSDMNGADVVLDITNNGTTVDVVATVYTKTGSVYTQKYMGITVDGDVYYCLLTEAGFLDVIGTTVGALDNSTGWWTAHSNTVKVEAGETANVTFRNYTSAQNNWNNFVVILQNVADVHNAEVVTDYKEYAVVRADNFGWGDGYATATLECTWNWDTFLSDINGALVDLAITNNGTTADIVATVTTKNGDVYTQKYLGITVDGDLYYCLSTELGWLCIFE